VRDDAVAPVVAAMLILAVVVTFFAAWNAYYVPSMKAQSEITHIREVESGFLKFSSDINTAISLKDRMELSEPIPLGGGDFTFDPVKSGGELKVWNASPDGYIRINWTNRSEPEPTAPAHQSVDHSSGLVKFSYTPVNNFWQEQGYVWSYGNVFVNNTERNLVTPLNVPAMTDLTYDGLARSLVGLEPKAYSSSGDCSLIIVNMVNITPDQQHTRISGNGNGKLVLKSTVGSETAVNTSSLNISIGSPVQSFKITLWNNLTATAGDIVAVCPNARLKEVIPGEELQLTFNPNLTLIRKTTEITIGAY
jgi:hypothetical protein